MYKFTYQYGWCSLLHCIAAPTNVCRRSVIRSTLDLKHFEARKSSYGNLPPKEKMERYSYLNSKSIFEMLVNRNIYIYILRALFERYHATWWYYINPHAGSISDYISIYFTTSHHQWSWYPSFALSKKVVRMVRALGQKLEDRQLVLLSRPGQTTGTKCGCHPTMSSNESKR